MSRLAVVLLLLAGCTVGIDPDAIDTTLTLTLNRHDTYTIHDKDLSTEAKQRNLRDSRLLREVVRTAKNEKAAEAAEEDPHGR